MKPFWTIGVGLLLGLSLSVCAATGSEFELGKAHRSGIVWPKDQALPTFAEAKHLDVADIEALPADETVGASGPPRPRQP